VEVVVLNDPECVAMMRRYTEENPQVWAEDIGE
jgi:cytosine deaminase